MECYACGEDHDILYSCEECKSEAGYCPDHRYDHEHVAPEPEPIEKPQEDIPGISKGKTITNENVWRLVPNAWTSGAEWKDLIIASFVLTFIFAFNIVLDFPDVILPTTNQLKQIAILGILVSIAFIGHELSHKVTAIHYGHDSRFVINIVYIAISMVLALANFAFIWVGAAVVLAKHGMGEEHGIIAGAGPFSNLIMGSIGILLFFLFDTLDLLLFQIWDVSLWFWVTTFVYLNGFVGLFNMIPFSILDGAKIWAWNRNVWLSLAFGLLSIWLLSFQIVPYSFS